MEALSLSGPDPCQTLAPTHMYPPAALPGPGSRLPQRLWGASRLGREGYLTPFLVHSPQGWAGAAIPPTHTPQLCPGGHFPSRTMPPSAEAGSSEGEHLPATSVQPSSRQAWPLPSSRAWLEAKANCQMRGAMFPVGMAGGSGLAAFAFIFAVVSWGSFSPSPRPWLRPVVTSQRSGWGHRARGLLGPHQVYSIF